MKITKINFRMIQPQEFLNTLLYNDSFRNSLELHTYHEIIIFLTAIYFIAGVTQLVECQLPKLDVAGSNPVARSLSSPLQESFTNLVF